MAVLVKKRILSSMALYVLILMVLTKALAMTTTLNDEIIDRIFIKENNVPVGHPSR